MLHGDSNVGFVALCSIADVACEHVCGVWGRVRQLLGCRRERFLSAELSSCGDARLLQTGRFADVTLELFLRNCVPLQQRRAHKGPSLRSLSHHATTVSLRDDAIAGLGLDTPLATLRGDAMRALMPGRAAVDATIPSLTQGELPGQKTRRNRLRDPALQTRRFFI